MRYPNFLSSHCEHSLQFIRPGRRIGQCWEATRAPTQGPRPRRGVIYGTPFRLHPLLNLGIGIKAINPGGLGAEPPK
jgi:hypothetical protein